MNNFKHRQDKIWGKNLNQIVCYFFFFASVALCQSLINPYCLKYKLNIMAVLYCSIIMCYLM